eukprot:CAMPEP_0172420798 /NCGR_PEP_ID=MMETSP1064-20121228/7132_1 /TAXON_ID=202472 /ORGANISM="Aulacoseira subarctica , Strain CCAP 1002/5" /LENGTH=788 /DNA_ID=CAMNT_0013160915 /DNA_START=287 /DNA_END=2653 /DNA_ORIENTATION=+
MQFDPSAIRIWKRWRGTVFSETWTFGVKNIIFATIVTIFLHKNAPVARTYLEGFNILWGQLLSVTTFTLTFFLNQSYSLWRKCYELSRRLQGRLNDLGMTLAAHAARTAPESNTTAAEHILCSTYTPPARQVLELVARYVRLFNLLTYASFTLSHRPILTPRGMRRLVERGLMTSREREVLVNATKLPATQKHNAVILWIMRVFIEARQAGHLLGGAGFEEQFLEKIHVIRAQYGAIGDELQARMPLAYAHIVQVLVDVILWMYPITAFVSGINPVLSVVGTGLMTMFYQGLFDLAKQFLDPYDNENYGKGDDPLCVDTLVAETNAGSLRWMYGFEDQPFDSDRLREGEMSDLILPAKGYSTAVLLEREKEVDTNKEREEKERKEREARIQKIIDSAYITDKSKPGLTNATIANQTADILKSKTVVSNATAPGEAAGVLSKENTIVEEPASLRLDSLSSQDLSIVGESIRITNQSQSKVISTAVIEETPMQSNAISHDVIEGTANAAAATHTVASAISIDMDDDSIKEMEVGSATTAREERKNISSDMIGLNETSSIEDFAIEETIDGRPTGDDLFSSSFPNGFHDWWNKVSPKEKEFMLSQILADEKNGYNNYTIASEEETGQEIIKEKPMTIDEFKEKAIEIVKKTAEELYETEAILKAPPGANSIVELDEEQQESRALSVLAASQQASIAAGLVLMDNNRNTTSNLDILEMDMPLSSSDDVVVDSTSASFNTMDNDDSASSRNIGSNEEAASPDIYDAIQEALSHDEGSSNVSDDGMLEMTDVIL